MHLGRLHFWSQVGVDNANASLQGHHDGHFVFCDSIHRTGNQGSLESNILGQLGRRVDLSNAESNMARHHDQVIVSIGHTSRVANENLRRSESASLVVLRYGDEWYDVRTLDSCFDTSTRAFNVMGHLWSDTVDETDDDTNLHLPFSPGIESFLVQLLELESIRRAVHGCFV